MIMFSPISYVGLMSAGGMARLSQSFGWAVLQSVWQIMAIALILSVCRVCLLKFGGEKTASVRYMVGITSLFGLLSAFVLSFLYAYGIKFAALPSQTIHANGTNISSAQDLSILFSQMPFLRAAYQAIEDVSAHTGLIGMIWAVCVGVLALRYCISFRLTQALRSQDLHPLPPNWSERFSTLAQNAGVGGRVEAFLSDHVNSPISFGFFKPVVLLPVWFFTGLDQDQCEAVLLHELAHIIRKDYLINILQIIAKTVLFYHPAIHYICKSINEDREHACDDFAVHHTNNPQSLASALGLVGIQAAQNSQIRGAAFVMAATHARSPLFKRLHRLMPHQGSNQQDRVMSLASSTKGFALSCLLVTVFLFTMTASALNNMTNTDQINVEKNALSLNQAAPMTPMAPVVPPRPHPPINAAERRTHIDTLNAIETALQNRAKELMREKARIEADHQAEIHEHQKGKLMALKVELIAALMDQGFLLNHKEKLVLKLKPDHAYINGKTISNEHAQIFKSVTAKYLKTKSDYQLFKIKSDYFHVQYGNFDGSNQYSFTQNVK